MAIAFFDIDGTLLKGYSGYYAALELVRSKLVKKRRLPQALFYKLLTPFYEGDVRKMYQVAVQDMVGSKISDLLAVGKRVFERDLKPHLFREGLEIIHREREAGQRIVFISSGPYMVIKNIEIALGADHSYSVASVVKDGLVQNELAEPFCYDGGKLTLALKEAASVGVSMKECSYYGDTLHDLPLLRAVGRPFAVNPDRILKKEALLKSWPILNFQSELGEGLLSCETRKIHSETESL